MVYKQKILYVALAVCVLALVVFSTFVVYKTFFNNNEVVDKTIINTSQDGSVTQLSPSETESISLNSTKVKDPNALSVKEPTELSTNLGSGRQNTSSGTSGSGASSGVPGPETFGAFEQYKNSETVMYQDLQMGTGTEVTADSQVAVLYKGYLTSGALFDQSRAGSDGKLQPFIFSPAAGQVITGFAQGVVGTKVGSVRRVIIPPGLGYGAEAQNGIPANSVLVFDIQVVSVQ